MYFCVYIIRSLKCQRAAQKRKIIDSSVKMNNPVTLLHTFVVPQAYQGKELRVSVQNSYCVRRKLLLKQPTLAHVA